MRAVPRGSMPLLLLGPCACGQQRIEVPRDAGRWRLRLRGAAWHRHADIPTPHARPARPPSLCHPTRCVANGPSGVPPNGRRPASNAEPRGRGGVFIALNTCVCFQRIKTGESFLLKRKLSPVLMRNGDGKAQTR